MLAVATGGKTSSAGSTATASASAAHVVDAATNQRRFLAAALDASFAATASRGIGTTTSSPGGNAKCTQDEVTRSTRNSDSASINSRQWVAMCPSPVTTMAKSATMGGYSRQDTRNTLRSKVRSSALLKKAVFNHCLHCFQITLRFLGCQLRHSCSSLAACLC